MIQGHFGQSPSAPGLFSLRRSPWVLLICCLLLVITSLSGCGAGAQKTAPREEAPLEHFYLPDLPALKPDSESWRAEPPFTEKEVGRFVFDVRSIETMNAAGATDYLLRDGGWTRERLRYMDVKLACIIMAINADNLSALSAPGPYHLPPTREELKAVQKYYSVLNSMLNARIQTGE